MNQRAIITQDIKNLVINMYTTRKANGYNQKIIAQHIGISERSVKRILDEAGLATAHPLIKGEAYLAMQLLKKYQLTADEMDAVVCQAIQISEQGPSRGQILKELVEMEEGTWAALLKDVITGRAAKKFNVGVQTAMLNISNEIDKNAKPR